MFDTSSLTTVASMFLNCTSLVELNLLSFDTSSVFNMNDLFENCSSLTELDLSSFDTSSVRYMYRMFYNCSKLETIYVGEGWTTDAVTTSSSMFNGCTSLLNYTSTTVNDVSKAHTGEGGYLTLKVSE